MIFSFYSVFVLVIASLQPFNVVSALHIPEIHSRDVWNPPITSPTATTIWKIGSNVTVTWDVSSMPQQATSSHGTILLGYLMKGSDSEHLNFKHPLAEGVDLKGGHATLAVPKVDPKHTYIVVVMGDSGNRSPTFTIQA